MICKTVQNYFTTFRDTSRLDYGFSIHNQDLLKISYKIVRLLGSLIVFKVFLIVIQNFIMFLFKTNKLFNFADFITTLQNWIKSHTNSLILVADK